MVDRGEKTGEKRSAWLLNLTWSIFNIGGFMHFVKVDRYCDNKSLSGAAHQRVCHAVDTLPPYSWVQSTKLEKLSHPPSDWP